MRIFYSFLIIACSVMLILLPANEGIYDFETDKRQDRTTVETTVGDNTTYQLFTDIFDDDTSTIIIESNDLDDSPVWTSYNTTTRALFIDGLAANTTRILTITYDIAAFTLNGVGVFFDILPFIWILLWVAFPVGAIISMYAGSIRRYMGRE